MIGVILWFLGARPSPHGERFAYLVAGYFCVAVAAMSLINRQAPPGSEPEKVAGWYRGRSFIKLGLLEAIVLFGFVGVFISGRYWMYLLGFGLALLVWPLAAPTSTSIQRDQQSLIAHGNPVDLLQVLTQPPSAPSD